MNGSIYFNGIDQYLQINYNPSLNLYGDFTIEFFAKCDINNKSLGTIIASVGGNGINQIEISINYDFKQEYIPTMTTAPPYTKKLLKESCGDVCIDQDDCNEVGWCINGKCVC